MLTKNINDSGRILRLLLSLLFLFLAFWNKSWVALAIAIFIFFEAYMSWCLLYQLIGKNDCPIKTTDKKEKK